MIIAINVGSKIPCGIFIPMLAIGACIGGILSNIWLEIDPAFAPYCDLLVMLCMVAFFTTVARAPITSIIMICEFTGSFVPLLPVIIAVSLGYIIGELCKTAGIYEYFLEEYERETEDVEYTIVGSTEVNLAENKISNESPIGRALLGAKKGATVEVDAPAGIIQYKILSITK